MCKRTRMMRAAAAALAAFLPAAAPPPPAATPPAEAAVPPPAGQSTTTTPREATFISPMGEPFRAAAGGVLPDLQWFRGADRNGDGRVTLVEMRADAYRFFKTLDLNHDGEVDPDELGHYETDVAPEVNVVDYGRGGNAPDSVSTSNDGPNDAFGDLPGVTIEHHKPRGRVTRGAGRLGYFDLPEPVAAADADLNRGVSAHEFDQAAQKRFLLLDTAHDGYLSYPKLQELRR